ncbi:hypothetical protein PLEOSDRAFT_1104605 [Pleurotus ostreatus PC15]|uniref:RRM domain-containing protein n=1 Tax=Pleurotus ostreatus (strain PC15) TaxID=1137138 RepID=A0A067NWD5_PLEO1|nr:hypothetical protein PLEOSDRAFT_1104605 [Pleurotus ostreatus PC15]
MSKVSIGNLSWNTNNDSLRELFSTYGEVVDTIVMRDAETGRSRGFGFITFSSEGEAAAAAEALDRSEVDGRRVKVIVSDSRPL